MQVAKLFQNGRSQAVRLPKDCRFPGEDVYVKKYGGMVVLFPRSEAWALLAESLDKFSDDFMDDREQPGQGERPGL